VALAFAPSGGFAYAKDAGDPCVHLRPDDRCRIHPELRDRGFAGCTVFDCQGTGQKITQVTFGGRSWREDPGSRELMFVTFQVMRPLHELLWYLHDARRRPETGELEAELAALYDETDALTRQTADDVLATDVRAQRDRVQPVLARASRLVRDEARRGVGGEGLDRVHADLAGADLRGVDLRGADLRGATLIRTDLRHVDLAGADLIGTDLRDADLGGADLSRALYVTQYQANSAKGDGGTRLPAAVSRPGHWV